MVFSEIFIRRPIMTTLVMVAVFLFGVAAYFKLPISDLPTVDYPVMTISVGYPGTSPSMMASTVASPLENECMEIPGLQKIISTNTEGNTVITLTFDLSRNVDLAAPDVQAAISRAQANLPGDLPQQPTYSKNNPSDAPIIYIMVTSDTMTPGELYDYGNRAIGKQLSMIEGVSQIQTWGAKTAVRVKVDPDKLAAYGIGIDEVANALKTGTVTIPGGSLNGKYRTFAIEPKGQLFKAKEYDELIVAYRNDAPVRVKDIGHSVDSLQNDVINVMYGHPGGEMQKGAVTVAAYRQAGANTVALSQRIKEKLSKLKNELPGSVNLEIFYDKADYIIESVNDVKMTIVIALILVVLVIFLFIGRLGDTVIPATVLPFTLLGTFVVMLLLGFSLDNLSLLALTLSIGFLVDDAIVVLENTERYIEHGEKPILATIKSMKEITGTVISTSVALITVFVPLIFMSGVVGRNFREFALTVVVAVICSTIMALTLTPMMCARMLKAKGATVTRMQAFTNKFVEYINSKYGIALRWVLRHRIMMVLFWIACLAGTLWLFSILPKTFMPEGDSGAIMGQILVPQGTSTEQVRKMQDQLNAICQSDPNVDGIITVTGIQPGADQSTGPFVITLKPRKEREPMEKVVAGLRQKAAGLTLGFVFFKAVPALQLSTGGESTALGSKYSYIVNGDDQDEVYKSALALEQKMYSLPGFVDIQNSVKLNMPQLDVKIFRDRASTLGVSAGDIEYALALGYAEGKLTTYKTDIDQYYVIVVTEDKFKRDPVDLSQIYVRSGVTGKMMPLATVAKWEEVVGPQNVPHYNQLNSGTISFNLKKGFPLGDATKQLEETARQIMPADVSGSLEGEAQEFEEAVKSLVVLMLISVFIMYVILGILYESYIHPLTVLTTLPVAAFGGLATLLIFDSELSLYAYIGMFMLLGIVAKNGIMMVDFANEYLEQGQTTHDAIYNACINRFRPILMTGISTIVGAMPIAMGFGADGASRRPLGLIVVGGLLFAQVITLLITPVIFIYMQAFQEKVLDRFELSRSVAARRGKEDEV